MSAIAVPSRVGFTGMQRENSITERMGVGLMALLSEAFEPTITFRPYPKSLDALLDRVTVAVEQGELEQDAIAAVHQALEPAATFLLNRPDDVDVPEIDVWPDGQIAFEWYVQRGRKVLVLINASGRVVYSAIRGAEHDGATAYVSGQWPVALVEAIHRTAR